MAALQGPLHDEPISFDQSLNQDSAYAFQQSPDRFRPVLEALANLSVSQPAGQVLAMTLYVTKSNLVITVASNTDVPQEVTSFVRRVWDHMRKFGKLFWDHHSGVQLRPANCITVPPEDVESLEVDYVSLPTQFEAVHRDFITDIFQHHLEKIRKRTYKVVWAGGHDRPSRIQLVHDWISGITVDASGEARDLIETAVGELRDMEALLWNIHRAFEVNDPNLSYEELYRDKVEFVAGYSLRALKIWSNFKLHHPDFHLEPIKSTTSGEYLSSLSFLLPTF